MLRFYEFNLPRFEPSLCPAEHVLHMLDFVIVTYLLLGDPMATGLEYGYIGLDIVDKLHFCRALWSTTCCTVCIDRKSPTGSFSSPIWVGL